MAMKINKCPYCGQTCHIYDARYLVDRRVIEKHRVSCQCGASGPWHKIKAMAIRLWNSAKGNPL